MGIGIALFVGIISLFIMLIIAKKWNIANRTNLMGVIIIALAVSMPFLWLYFKYHSGWQLIISIVAQISLSLIIALALVLYHFWRDLSACPPKLRALLYLLLMEKSFISS